MDVLRFIENSNDKEIQKLKGRFITVTLTDGSFTKGIVTNFIGAIAENSKRTIVGIILDHTEELPLSSDIKSIIIESQ